MSMRTELKIYKKGLKRGKLLFSETILKNTAFSFEALDRMSLQTIYNDVETFKMIVDFDLFAMEFAKRVRKEIQSMLASELKKSTKDIDDLYFAFPRSSLLGVYPYIMGMIDAKTGIRSSNKHQFECILERY